MHEKEAKNLRHLQGHLVKDSLAWKLVAAYIDAHAPGEVEPALDAVLNSRLREVLDAIDNGKAELD